MRKELQQPAIRRPDRVSRQLQPHYHDRMPISARVQAFRELHHAGCFVIPNPWDVGSARLLEQLGFKALATTSAGLAWSLGRADNHVTLDEVLAHIRAIAGSVNVPVNVDFEGGFASDPDGVASNVALAAGTGIAGVSIEDSTGDASNPLFAFDVAVARIRAARRALDETATGVMLIGRSEGFITGRPDLDETIRRLRAYADAGADCLYAPGLQSSSDVSHVVKAVAPKPVNVLMGRGSDFATVAGLAALGVRRISVGGALARVALTGFLDAAREIADHGTFELIGRAMPFADLNSRFQHR
jgi:2-methylisocitrate lyase-like PEP mutase family enzyme